MHTRSQRTAWRPHGASRPPRGNTIVLVSALLVLLVIIATAYISRTQVGRATSGAVRDMNVRETNVRSVQKMLADVPAQALFVYPFDVAPGFIDGANAPRLAPLDFRYGWDPVHPYHFAPYQVVPWTNWPDFVFNVGFGGFNASNAVNLPAGPGNPDGGTNGFLRGEFNPLGNPGSGDTRWLACLEPLRWNTGETPAGPGYLDALSHWRHLTNIARINNGFRIVTDASDVFDSDGDFLGRLLTNLDLPVEQWLAVRPALGNGGELFSAATGDVMLPSDIAARFRSWFFDYANTYHDPRLVPPNFVNLSDLDGDGFHGEAFQFGNPDFVGERPQDEFNLGTARAQISRFLADADGDGYTDSFWFLVPGPVEKGVRQIVAVRIVDNCAKVNINTSSRFFGSDQFVDNSIDDDFWGARSRSRGHTGADVALVGQNAVFQIGVNHLNNWNTGLFDLPANDEQLLPFFAYVPGYQNLYRGATWQKWSPGSWDDNFEYDFLDALGLTSGDVATHSLLSPPSYPFGGNMTPILATALHRLHYWQAMGRNPFDPDLGLTPFTAAEEIELASFFGQNHPYLVSRLERSAQLDAVHDGGGGLPTNQILRSNTSRRETSEHMDQLDNRELLNDLRHLLTAYSGARNDEIPPWLWWRWFDPNGNAFLPEPVLAQINAGADFDTALFNFLRQSRRKLDLREVFDPFLRPGELSLAQRLPLTLYQALTDQLVCDTTPDSFYGLSSGMGLPVALDKSARLAAGFSANLLERCDPDIEGVLLNAVPVPLPAEAWKLDPERRFLGIEPQPFITEVFLGHVYQAVEIPPFDGTPPAQGGPLPYPPGEVGKFTVFHGAEAKQSTFIVVQLANPFDVPIDLSTYVLNIFGIEVDLQSVGGTLWPTTPEDPRTAVIFSMDSTFGGGFGGNSPSFRDAFADFLDIQTENMPAGSRLIDLHDENLGVLPSLRTHYDDFGDSASDFDGTVTLARKDRSYGGEVLNVVVDRLEAPEESKSEFAKQVSQTPLPSAELDPPDVYAQGAPEAGYPGLIIGQRTHMVQWVRATRAWGVDIDNNQGYEADERNPRYVCADHAVVLPLDSGLIPDPAGAVRGSSFVAADDPDTPWFKRAYRAPDNTELKRKPTFFDMNRENPTVFFDDGGGTLLPFPDKGWYAQAGPKLNGVDNDVWDGSSRSRLDFPMQMMQKDGNFEQVGELLNVWMFGHELEFQESGEVPPNDYTYTSTLTTFSEFMGPDNVALVGQDIRINRLPVVPTDPNTGNPSNAASAIGQVIGDTAPTFELNDPAHAIPDLPAGIRVLDAFVCDGRGLVEDFDHDGTVGGPNDVALWQQLWFNNAQGFTGAPTYGSINPNTAPLKVLRTLPHWYKMIHELASPTLNPRVALAEAVIQARESADGQLSGQPGGPNYAGRGAPRGFASPHEIATLRQAATAALFEPAEPNDLPAVAWRADYLAQVPDLFAPNLADISTDVTDLWREATDHASGKARDRVAGDAEEANLLYSGSSNILSTRSDMFTVYFKVRTFRQRPDGVWNALDKDQIIDDSRYVMLVDRSRVTRPTDAPRIVYVEKVE